MVVSGPVIVENNKVLLSLSGDDAFWKFCGGKMEDTDATPLDTACREIKEEMNLEIDLINSEPFVITIQKNTNNGLQEIKLMHYLAKRIGDIKPGADIREWQWFDIDNLPDNLAPNIIPTLKHFGFIK